MTTPINPLTDPGLLFKKQPTVPQRPSQQPKAPTLNPLPQLTPAQPTPDTYRAKTLPGGTPVVNQPLFEETKAPLAANEIADGVAYTNHHRTKDGGVVRVLTIDPKKAEIVPVFHPKPAPMSAHEVTDQQDLLGAINASFFGKGLVGDILADATHLFRDNWDAHLDSITDNRYFIGVTKNGDTLTGRGGIDENNPSQFKHFVGGFPALFTTDNVRALEQDIHNGTFAKRADYGGASQNSSISRSFMGVNAKGDILLVAAGEGNKRSKGVTMAEGARLLKGMGAVEAYVLDGGGSTSLYAKGKDFAPTDGRKVWSYLGIRAKK